MKIFKILRSILLSVVFVSLLICGAYFYLAKFPASSVSAQVDALASSMRSFPAQSGQKEISLKCDYHGKSLRLDETLYQSIDDFYRTEPKKMSYFANNDNKSFVFTYSQDKTLDEITSKIRTLAVVNKLNDDQTLDLAGCFVQGIPYDAMKAAKILSPDFLKYQTNDVIPRFPYETLYDGLGVCTDKSYLGAAIFERLGYGTSLLEFDKEKHMTVGVQTPIDYRSFGTDYSIYEMTGVGFAVGDLPHLATNNGFAKNSLEIESQTSSQSDLTAPSHVEIVSSGKIYTRIVDRNELKNQLTTMQVSLVAKKAKVDAAQQNLVRVESDLKAKESAYKSQNTAASYSIYHTAYQNYTTVYSSTNELISAYNLQVMSYNKLLEKYRQY